jgi:hypothetical protein
VPVNISLGYQQVDTYEGGADVATQFVNAFFCDAGSPWLTFRGNLSDQLVWECCVITIDQETFTQFLSGAEGTANTASPGSAIAVQFDVMPANPHPSKRAGRFFLPGILEADIENGGFTEAFHTQLRAFAASMKVLLDPVDSDVVFALMPHGKYRDKNGDTADVLAQAAFHNPFVKVIGNRKPDLCTAFTGAGSGNPFTPIVVPPPV